jgi:Fic/DOC family
MLNFLTPKQLIAVNATLGYNPLNTNLVGSCLSSWHYYNTVELQISSVVYGIVKNHAFQDGNKRTAVVTYYTLCSILHKPALPDGVMFEVILQIAGSNNMSVEDVAILLFPISK